MFIGKSILWSATWCVMPIALIFCILAWGPSCQFCETKEDEIHLKYCLEGFCPVPYPVYVWS